MSQLIISSRTIKIHDSNFISKELNYEWEKYISYVSFSKYDDRILITGYTNIYILNSESFNVILKIPSINVNKARFSNDESKIICGYNNKIKIYSAINGNCLSVFDMNYLSLFDINKNNRYFFIYDLFFNSTDDRIICKLLYGDIHILDAISGIELLHIDFFKTKYSEQYVNIDIVDNKIISAIDNRIIIIDIITGFPILEFFTEFDVKQVFFYQNNILIYSNYDLYIYSNENLIKKCDLTKYNFYKIYFNSNRTKMAGIIKNIIAIFEFTDNELIFIKKIEDNYSNITDIDFCDTITQLW